MWLLVLIYWSGESIDTLTIWYVWNLIMYRNWKLDSLWGSTLPKRRILWKKASNKSYSKSNLAKKARERICLSPPGSTLPKRRILWKKASNKSYSKSNLAKKVRERICLSPPRVELEGSKDQYVWNLIMYRNGKLDSLWGSTLPKIHFLWKKASDKSCSKSNFA